MDIEHIPVKSLRAYLLGTLADEDAAAVEVRYFVSRSCLLQMQAEERALIENYLDGLLTPDEEQQFEGRYLRIPSLIWVVDEVKRERATTVDRGSSRGRLLGLAWAGAVLCTIALCVWIYYGRRPGPEPATAGIPLPKSPPAVTLRLTPGVTMGGKAARMDLPQEQVPVKLVAELPGLSTPVECGARLSLVGDGRWIPVWSAGPVLTLAGSGGQELTLLLNPSLLHSGDYILEVTMPNGQVRETYLFHVSQPR